VRRMSRRARLGSRRRAWALRVVVGVAALAMVALGGVLSTLAPPSVSVRRTRTPPPAAALRTRATHSTPRRASPVSANDLSVARAAASSFIVSYLRVAYGHAPASSVTAATPALRAELSAGRERIPPAEREHHPRVASVEAMAESPGVVIATAAVTDGGIATYALRVMVEQGPRGWLVSDLDGG
jgi:hypothetical protein